MGAKRLVIVTTFQQDVGLVLDVNLTFVVLLVVQKVIIVLEMCVINVLSKITQRVISLSKDFFKYLPLLILLSISGYFATRYLITLNAVEKVFLSHGSLSKVNDIIVIDVNGKGKKLGELFGDSTKLGFVLLVTSSGCITCLDDLLVRNSLHSTYGAEYELIGLVDNSDPALFVKFNERDNFTFPVYQIDRQTFLDLNIRQLPTYFLFEKRNSTPMIYDKYTISELLD
jgi:hypothetical protein